jgi:quaternary ammonium compound-resistance protein SugE
MDWIILFIAGLFEVGFTTFLKLSNQFTRPGPTIGFLIFAFLSFYSLSLSLKTIPIGTSYAIWTGIGATGTALIGIIFFGEPATFLRLFFLTMIIASLIGLKLVS